MRKGCLIALLWLMALAVGCSRAPLPDARLVLADSLMLASPDSALAIVEGIDPAALPGEGDRAYRELLLAQARYRCYVTATADSGINRALDYYTRHSDDRDKLTRAHLYKGAVMEELGHPDSAMRHYKAAEAAADPNDHFNLGQINVRIASLYKTYYVDSQTCYDKYAEAYNHYKIIGDKRMQMVCLFNMGGSSGITRIGNPEVLLEQAYRLAAERNDSAYCYSCRELLCRQLVTDGKSVQRAKQIAIRCLNDYARFVNNDLLLDLAHIFSHSDRTDSARLYLNLVNEREAGSNIGQLKTRKYLILSQIAKREGNMAASDYYDRLSLQAADSIENIQQRYDIRHIENKMSQEQTAHRGRTIQLAIQRKNRLVIAVIILSSIALLTLSVLYHRRKKWYVNLIKELRLTSIDTHEDRLNKINATKEDSTISQFIMHVVGFMHNAIEMAEHNPPAVVNKRIKEEVVKLTADDEFWVALESHLDHNFNGLVRRLRQNPRMTKKDLRFIELCCCGFNYVEISIILDYAPKYISQKRKAIATKLGLDEPLRDYLDKEMGIRH